MGTFASHPFGRCKESCAAAGYRYMGITDITEAVCTAYPSGYTGSTSDGQAMCEHGNTLNDGYLYIYNAGRNTGSPSCVGSCWCCRKWISIPLPRQLALGKCLSAYDDSSCSRRNS